MSETVFRKKSLDRMKSPDNLDQYIQVANPSSWILLLCILFLLVGVIIWGFFGTIESSVVGKAYVENKTATCSVENDRIGEISSGMVVRIGDAEGTVWTVNPQEGTVVIKIDVPDGAYDANIVTETINPMSLIFD